MREIKFRAWNKEKNIMVYDNEDEEADYWDGVIATVVGLVNYHLNDGWGKKTYVYMQYTGLKDKIGVEIYEGDIVKKESGFGLGYREGKPKYGKVTFYKDVAAYCIEYKDQREANVRYAHLVHTESDLEVFGNIYENPELLKEETE